jgi:flagellar assembly factor FliW
MHSLSEIIRIISTTENKKIIMINFEGRIIIKNCNPKGSQGGTLW